MSDILIVAATTAEREALKQIVTDKTKARLINRQVSRLFFYRRSMPDRIANFEDDDRRQKYLGLLPAEKTILAKNSATGQLLGFIEGGSSFSKELEAEISSFIIFDTSNFEKIQGLLFDAMMIALYSVGFRSFLVRPTKKDQNLDLYSDYEDEYSARFEYDTQPPIIAEQYYWGDLGDMMPEGAILENGQPFIPRVNKEVLATLELFYEKCNNLGAAKRYAEAIKSIDETFMYADGKRLRELEYDRITLMNNRAYYNYHLGNYEEALSDTERAAKIDCAWQKKGLVYHTRAEILMAVNRKQEALEAINEAIRKWPTPDKKEYRNLIEAQLKA